MVECSCRVCQEARNSYQCVARVGHVRCRSLASGADSSGPHVRGAIGHSHTDKLQLASVNGSIALDAWRVFSALLRVLRGLTHLRFCGSCGPFGPAMPRARGRPSCVLRRPWRDGWGGRDGRPPEEWTPRPRASNSPRRARGDEDESRGGRGERGEEQARLRRRPDARPYLGEHPI